MLGVSFFSKHVKTTDSVQKVPAHQPSLDVEVPLEVQQVVDDVRVLKFAMGLQLRQHGRQVDRGLALLG